MNKNILSNSATNKIYLVFEDGNGLGRKELVELRYMEEKSSFFVGSTLANFKKPKWKAEANIIIYTPEGIYIAKTTIQDTTYTMSDISYHLDTPKSWEFKQLRAGTRKRINLPVKISFSDGLEIESETLDLSVSGFSIMSNTNLSTVHKRFNHRCSIQFTNNDCMYFPNCNINTEVKFVREKSIKDNFEFKNYSIYCFKFVELDPETFANLKQYLMK